MSSNSNKLDRVLSKCIQSIEERGWTVDDCLKQYPSYRTELEPMLRTAVKLRQATKFSPSMTFQRDAQSRIRKRLASSRRSPGMIKPSPSSPSRRLTQTTIPKVRLAGTLIPIFLISFIIIAIGGSLAYAADHANPGDLLYQVDRAIEQFRIKLENDLQNIVRLHLQFADERIKEAIELVDRGDMNDLSSALAGYREQIVATAPLIQEAQTTGADINTLITETSDMIAAHKKKLEDLLESAPIEFEGAIRDTIDDAERIQEIVEAPFPTEEPKAGKTSDPFVYEPVTPTIKAPTHIPPTIPATMPATNAPPLATNTPGSFTLPSSTAPSPYTRTPTPTYFPYATPTPGTATTTYTPTKTKTPTPTPTPTPTLPKGGPTTPPAER